jgi:hypothetical protein
VPIFVFVVMRGLSRRELHAVLTTIVIATPFSIYITYQEMLVVVDAQKYIETGSGIAYNSYVPYTTFPLFASVYLLSQASSRVNQILIAIPACIIAVFIFTNLSRQSVIFVILGFIIFVGCNFSARNILITSVLSLIIVISVSQLGISNRVVSRFFTSEVTETTRTDSALAGIRSINGVAEWTLGNGLDMNLLQGGINPHNNYVFTVMRIGLLGMILTFLPFVNSFAKLIPSLVMDYRKAWFDNNLFALKAISAIFMLYHSFFNYPNNDSINGPVVWLGLGICVVFDSDFQMREALLRRRLIKDIKH